MTAPTIASAPPLPADVEEALGELVAAAREALRDDLASIVLFGSAAEGRLRATSDVNVLFVLARFDRARVDALREPLRTARAAVAATPMFLLATELPEAAEAFAVKFADLRSRHRVLHGDDPFANLRIPREAQARLLRQLLLNQAVRLRERYATLSLREEQLARALAELAGPLRAAAATLLELEGRPAGSPREALASVAAASGRAELVEALGAMSRAREHQPLPPGAAATAFLALMELTGLLRERSARVA